MSLGGLALGVGMLVDNAIVVIENIFRHQEMGESREKAATAGASEVANAIIASTLTTICVFFPMVFVVGIAGQLFKELAFTVIFSLIGSLWVALTLIPLLSCKLGGSEEEVAKGAAAFAGGEKWKKLVEKYDVLLRRFIRHKGIALTFVVVLFLGSLFVVNALEKELLPKVDQGAFDVKMDMPVGTKLMITNDAILRVEEIINKYPDVESVSSVAGSTSGKKAKDVVQKMGSHQAKSIVKLKEKTKVRTADLVQEIKERLKKEKILKDANIEFTLQQGAIAGAFGGGGKPITIEVKGERLDALEDMAREIEGNLEQIKGIFGIEDDIPKASPEVRINVDKDKASLYEISVVDLARIAQMVLRGYVSSQFKEKGREIDIRVRLRKVDRDTFGKLYHIRLAMPQGGMIPLGTVANFERGKGPSEIKRLGQERTITIAAGIVNRKLSDVVNDVEKMLDQTKVRPGYTIRLAGESEEMKKSFDSLRFALIFAIVLVYMVMAAQFESITQPLIILFTVPLSLIGVLLALFATSTSVSVVALLGVIILGGIVVNNGIVLVDYTNILISKGKTPLEAVVESGKARLRPIVMTALTTVLGLFPMALAVSRGGKLMAPMAISVMGGLIIATFFTPFVIPSIFILENDIRGSIVKFFKKETDKKNKQETNIQ